MGETNVPASAGAIGDPSAKGEAGEASASLHLRVQRSDAARQRVLMVTAVWGDWYLDAHLHLNLPSLLSAQNLPAFFAAHDVTYLIVTRAADVETIRAAPAMQAIMRLAAVEIRVIPERELADPIAAHHSSWARATERAKATEQFVLYLPPDVAWSDGSFAHLARLLGQGHSAIFMTYLRVVSETFTPAARRHLDASGHVLTIPGRELVELSLRHAHPLMAAHMHDSPYFPIHPEMVIWPVRGEGLAVRCLAREMFLFDPNRFRVNQQLLVGDERDAASLHFIGDSDQLYAVSLAPLGKDVAWHTRAAAPDDMTIARWWLTYDSPVNDVIAATFVRWHHAPLSEARWRRVERASRLWVRRAAAQREGLRIWRLVADGRGWLAAHVLATALHTRILARALRGAEDRPALVFVPGELALSALRSGWQQALVAPGALARVLRYYVVLDAGATARPLADRLGGAGSIELTSLAGERLELRADADGLTLAGRRLVDGGTRAGRNLVYGIDGVLDPVLAGCAKAVVPPRQQGRQAAQG